MNLKSWLGKNWGNLKAWLTAPTIKSTLNTFPINVVWDTFNVPFEEDVSLSGSFLKRSVESMLERAVRWLLLPLGIAYFVSNTTIALLASDAVTTLFASEGLLWLRQSLMHGNSVFVSGWCVGILCVGLLRHRKASPLVVLVSYLEYVALLWMFLWGLFGWLFVSIIQLSWVFLIAIPMSSVWNAILHSHCSDLIRAPLLFFTWYLFVVLVGGPWAYWFKTVR